MYTWHLPQSTSAFWQLKTTSDVLMHTGIWNSPPAINPSSGYLTRKVKRPFNLSARWRLRHLTESRGSGSNRHKTEEHRKLRWSQPPQDAPPTPSPSNRKNEIAGTEMASTTPGCTARPQPKQQKKWDSGNWDGLNHLGMHCPPPAQAAEKMRKRELRWPQPPQDPPPRHPRSAGATFGILSPSESTMTQNKGKLRETGSWMCVLGGRVKVRVTQSCPTLCDPMDYIVHAIFQARILKWVAFPFSRDLPKPGNEPRPPVLQADSLPAHKGSSGDREGGGVAMVIYMTKHSKISLFYSILPVSICDGNKMLKKLEESQKWLKEEQSFSQHSVCSIVQNSSYFWLRVWQCFRRKKISVVINS